MWSHLSHVVILVTCGHTCHIWSHVSHFINQSEKPMFSMLTKKWVRCLMTTRPTYRPARPQVKTYLIWDIPILKLPNPSISMIIFVEFLLKFLLVEAKAKFEQLGQCSAFKLINWSIILGIFWGYDVDRSWDRLRSFMAERPGPRSPNFTV